VKLDKNDGGVPGAPSAVVTRIKTRLGRFVVTGGVPPLPRERKEKRERDAA
jgi:hypothetical protein